jgi:methylmalonyl-CoA carboxyltransferase large subunit
MNSQATAMTEIQEVLRRLSDELARLNERVAALEAGASRQAVAAPSVAPAASEGPSEELVLVITAAVAAYLGVKPRIRQVRLLGSPSWAQQGRATIQASHVLNIPHASSHG